MIVREDGSLTGGKMNEKTKHRFSIDWTRSRQARFQAQHSEEKDPNDPLGEGKSLGKQGVLLLVETI